MPRNKTVALRICVPTARGRGVTRYRQLYEVLSAALKNGEITAGSALPSEPELVSRFHVSRTTVRRALARLEAEGRVVRRRGSGTFAREGNLPSAVRLQMCMFYETRPASQPKLSVTVVNSASANVPMLLREAHPELETGVTVVRHVGLYEGRPYQLSSAYIPEAFAKRVRSSRGGRVTVMKLLEDLKKHTARCEYAANAVAADSFAAGQLDVPLGTPLLRVRAALRDEQDRLRALDESLFRPDLMELHAQLERRPSRRGTFLWRIDTR